MSDILTTWDAANGRGDWTLSAGALTSGNDLYTAVLISLFTDRRAQPSDIIPDGTTNPRGWWGDMTVEGNLDEWGSRLWLLDRSIAPTQAVLNAAIGYCQEALAWLVTDGVAAKVDVQANWNANNFLAVLVSIYQTNGTKPVNMTYNLLWNEIGV